MNKLRKILGWLQLNRTNLPLKKDETDQSIHEYVHSQKSISYTPESLSENENLSKQKPENLENYELAFSKGSYGSWYQTKIITWSELVVFLRHYSQHNHYCYLPIEKNSRILCHLNETKHKNVYKDDHLRVEAKWYKYKNSGVIGVWITIDSGDCGDEDGFGVEFGEYYTAILDENGSYLLPFTDVQEREAQWQSLLYGVEWRWMNGYVKKEFETWQMNQEK